MMLWSLLQKYLLSSADSCKTTHVLYPQAEEPHFRGAEDCGRGNAAVPHTLQTIAVAS